MATARPRVTITGGHEPELAFLDQLVPQLCGLAVSDALRRASVLSARQRAHLAVFCYGRLHLRELALALASTCPLPVLLGAAPSDACGRAIYEATRGAEEPAGPLPTSRRPVTLASAASSAALFQLATDELEDDAPLLQADRAAGDCDALAEAAAELA
jgi:hypothetical protein